MVDENRKAKLEGQEESKFQQRIKDLPANQIGHFFRDYLTASNDAGWEGFNSEEMKVIRKLFADMQTYYDNK